MGDLRVVDFGSVTALRSQSLWHALCKSAGKSGKTTLSFMRPSSSYVGVGLLRNLEEVDVDFCNAKMLPIIRRQVGGGPVFLDQHQLFFQVCLPATSIPRTRHLAITKILSPFTWAFKAAGIDAEIDRRGEISVKGSKVCGHGAGEIGEGVAVVGNLIEQFDFSMASSIIRTGSAGLTTEIEKLMRRHIGSFESQIHTDSFVSTAIDALAKALGLRAKEGTPDPEEWDIVEEFDSLLGDPAWTSFGEFGSPPLPEMRIIKIRAGVYLVFRQTRNPTFSMSCVFGFVESFIMESCDDPSAIVGLTIGSAFNRLWHEGYLSDSEFNRLKSSEITREAIFECPN